LRKTNEQAVYLISGWQRKNIDHFEGNGLIDTLGIYGCDFGIGRSHFFGWVGCGITRRKSLSALWRLKFWWEQEAEQTDTLTG
jgi:hypothetical protein